LLASISGSIRFTEHWIFRATWDRVTTGNDRDTDIFLAGLSSQLRLPWDVFSMRLSLRSPKKEKAIKKRRKKN
jgi:hypothetical protein